MNKNENEPCVYDVAIIGGGPGGYVCAIRAAQLGLKTCVIEKEHIGGICLNWGCIPTKALLRSAEVYRTLKESHKFGIQAERVSFDVNAIVKRSRKVSNQLSSGVAFLLKKNKVHVVMGTASFENSTILAVKEKKSGTQKKIHANNIVIATGARSRPLPVMPDDKRIWTYREALIPSKFPKSLLIVGSGAIGIEFASFYHTFGTDVTVVERTKRIMPAEDEEISDIALKSFSMQGMKIITGAELKSATCPSSSSSLLESVIVDGMGHEQKIQSENILVAVGVVQNTEGMNIEKIGISLDRNGFIATNKFCETSVSSIYAIGDVAGAPCLAHKASHEGVIVAEHITSPLNIEHGGIDRKTIPGCTYTYPQIASFGWKEKEALDAGYDITVGRFPFIGNGKAIALGEQEGMIKTIFDKKTGAILGAHMIGVEVTELLSNYLVAQKLETTEDELIKTIFPHPTLGEMLHESVLNAFGRAIHI